MTAQAELWWAAGGAILLALLSGVAEWRRSSRRRLDQVGWVPWSAIQMLAFFAAAILMILAIRA